MLGALVAVVVIGHGAPLEAPADPASDDYPARPEWYFLWLFRLLRVFHGEREVIATVIVPGAILSVMALIPLFDKILPRGFAHFLACAVVFGVVGGAGYLTYSGWRGDAADPSYREGPRAGGASAPTARMQSSSPVTKRSASRPRARRISSAATLSTAAAGSSRRSAPDATPSAGGRRRTSRPRT